MSSALTFRELKATAVRLPMSNPIRTASGLIADAPFVLIDLHTEQGVTGHAYLFVFTPIVLKPLATLIASFGELLEGKRLAPLDTRDLLESQFHLVGNTGLVSMAVAGVEMALWDAHARALGVPLVRALGGAPQPVPAYSSIGMLGVDASCRLAEQSLARGFRAMKIKIGYVTLEQDLEVVRAVKSVLGEQSMLCVDYNQGLTLDEAIRRCRALDEFGLGWIEEPTRQNDYAGHARIARETLTPIQMGENCFGTSELAQCIAAGASDLLMFDLMKIGGVSRWLHGAALAEAASLSVSTHNYQEFSAHLMAVTPTAHWLQYYDYADAVLAEPMRIVDGNALPSETPGSGVEWNPAALARYRIA
ncbi:mandelate racemase [Burkholderia pseudomallei]|uniref:Mandelate racemase n=1 Tax=Burkholderia pseudomallei TaxID=28450 RepID=A0A1S0SR91_BURPE|nr:enolase C-terminal domain-like protein [Burkholderia pseudomallei]KGW51635.1 mandelate racemase [Burkholderia pseudomallei MSHR684]KGX74427.1 mandelate racemase [Burkholderia pseudomallei MSHR435]ABN81651.1 mandelate racemase [Burkholderia pseudomallei 668]AHE34983.1 mandelate racemase [Burkholderia pseudomallei NAU20B-16]AHG35585.1 mandelate racemase [Burkholderia pseudomallei MSHR511]